MRYLTILALVALATACNSKQVEQPRTGSLAERVGSESGVEQIVSALSTNVQKDERLAPTFAKVDMSSFQSNMTALLCAKIKADCGKDGTAQVPADLQLTDDEFAAFMEVFIVSMNDAELPQQEQNDLLDAMMAMQGDFVTQ